MTHRRSLKLNSYFPSIHLNILKFKDTELLERNKISFLELRGDVVEVELIRLYQDFKTVFKLSRVINFKSFERYKQYLFWLFFNVWRGFKGKLLETSEEKRNMLYYFSYSEFIKRVEYLPAI